MILKKTHSRKESERIEDDTPHRLPDCTDVPSSFLLYYFLVYAQGSRKSRLRTARRRIVAEKNESIGIHSMPKRYKILCTIGRL